MVREDTRRAASVDDPARLRSAWRVGFFTAVFRRRLQRGFAAVRLSGAVASLERLDGLPIVLYANHPSWWDAALLAVLASRLFPGHRAFAPIDAESLQRYPFMRRCGVFGVKPSSRAGAAALLRVGGALLARDDSILCITPQGRFTDARVRPLGLQRGLAHLLARAGHVAAIPVAIEYPFWNESRPEALVRLGAPLIVRRTDRHDADTRNADRRNADRQDADAWQMRLEAALTVACDALAVDAEARDPSRFTTWIEGRVGVGGIYDIGRRIGAWSAGRAFDARHLPPPGTRDAGRS